MYNLSIFLSLNTPPQTQTKFFIVYFVVGVWCSPYLTCDMAGTKAEGSELSGMTIIIICISVQKS